jgi:hypothetical protein
MNYTQKIKNIKDIDKLSTKRLLSYYKARRKDRISFLNSHTCDCCGWTTWDFHPKEKYAIEAKNELDILEKHLEEVKELLSKREHVRR